MLQIQPRFGKKIQSRFLPFFAVLLCCGFSPQLRAQATVYIDPTYTGGSNDGTLAHPYISWANIVFNDNTSYLQKRGTTCMVSYEIAIDEKTGVNFGVYGTGTDYAHITTTRATGAIFKLEASLNSTVKGFHLKASDYVQPNGASNYGIYVVDKENQNATVILNAGNITIKNCYLEHFVWGIRLMEIGYSNLDNITIDSCIIRDIFQDGIFVQSTQSPQWFNPAGLYGLVIDHCYISQVNASFNYYQSIGTTPTEVLCGGDGIQLSKRVGGYIIRNTTIDRRGTGLKFCLIHGDEEQTNAYSGTIQDCTFYTSDQNGFGGLAHYFAFLATLTYKNNRIFTNQYSGGIMLRGGTAMHCSYNTFSGSTSSSLYSMDVGSGPLKVHNNVFYNQPRVLVYTSGYNTTQLFNNVFQNTGAVNSIMNGVYKDYNCYYNAGSWFPDTSQEIHSFKNVDPKFVNPASGVFYLQSTSPVINTGKALGYISDLLGTAVPQGGTPDMGAIEYLSTANPSPSVPIGLTAAGITNTGFTLSWTASTDNGSVTGYDVHRDGVWYNWVPGATSLAVSGLAAGTTYAFKVYSKDNQGAFSAASAVIYVKTTGNPSPTVPIGLVATNITSTGFTLSWNNSTDNGWIKGYDVQKNGVWIQWVTNTSVVVTGLAPATTYVMKVNSKDNQDVVSGLATLNVTTASSFGRMGQAAIAPLAPAGLRLYPNPASNQVQLELSGPSVVSIIDASGKTILIRKFAGGRQTLPFRLPAGLYNLKITAAGKEAKTSRLVIE